MSDWPPTPNPTPNPPPSPHSGHNSQSPHVAVAQGDALQILEKAVLASVQEQRRARRWNIFFKLLGFGYVLLFILLLGRGCSLGKAGSSPVGVSSAHLAVIEIDGTIGSGANNVNSEDVSDALGRAFEAQASKAVALKINSPGGSPVQSDEIWQEIKRLQSKYPEKKVYAVIGDMGASGAYYIASAANEIYVNPSSLVGSIGVIMPNYGVTGLAQKLGVEDRTLTAGSHKALLSPTQAVDAGEKAHVQAVLDNVHQHFIDAVKQGRGTRLKPTADTFSGLFWSGDQAIALGLADKAGSVTTLARQLKLDQTVDYTVEKNPLESLLGRMGASVGKSLGTALQQQLQSQQEPRLQ